MWFFNCGSEVVFVVSSNHFNGNVKVRKLKLKSRMVKMLLGQIRLSIIYEPDWTNQPEEGLVRGYKKGTGPNDILNGPDRSSTMHVGISMVTE